MDSEIDSKVDIGLVFIPLTKIGGGGMCIKLTTEGILFSLGRDTACLSTN